MKHIAKITRATVALLGGIVLTAALSASPVWNYNGRPPAYPRSYDPTRVLPPWDANSVMPGITPFSAPFTLQTAIGNVSSGGPAVVNNFTLTRRTNVLIRGLGPTAGGTWRFSNPTVTLLHQKTDGSWETLGTNSDWTTAVPQTGGPVLLENIMLQVSASPLSRTSGDAALYLQLDAGNYSAQLTATGGAGGAIYVDLLQPSGVTVASDGSVFVTDSRALWKISGGTTTRIAGTGMLTPGGMTTDAAGNAYLVDEGNSRILKVTSAGVVSTFAGLSGSTGFRDGQGAAARFNAPRGITIDGSNLYVTDAGNSAIRKIDASANVTTLNLTEGADNNPPVIPPVVPPVTPPSGGGGGGGGGGGAINPFVAALLALLGLVRWFSGAKKNTGGNA